MPGLTGNITLEIDTYWALAAGCDVADLLEERKEHLRFIHLKDKKNGAKRFCPLGEGDVDNRTWLRSNFC